MSDHCNACNTKPIRDVYDEAVANGMEPKQHMDTYKAAGWKFMKEHAGIVKQCPDCAAAEGT